MVGEEVPEENAQLRLHLVIFALLFLQPFHYYLLKLLKVEGKEIKKENGK